MHCFHLNPIITTTTYDERILLGLPHYGALVSVNNPALRYPLRVGPNVIGVGTVEKPDVQLARDTYTHNGLCYISRRHCTLTVEFNKHNGQLRYLIKDGDGSIDPETGQHNASKNFTFYQDKKMDAKEEFYLNDQDIINLGGEDEFRLEQYVIPEKMLETYKIIKPVEEGGTTY
jgi:hypothetical protein